MPKRTPSPAGNLDAAAHLNRLACDAWTIHNILITLHAALPDDAADSAIPVRCLLSHIVELANVLASDLMEVEHV